MRGGTIRINRKVSVVLLDYISVSTNAGGEITVIKDSINYPGVANHGGTPLISNEIYQPGAAMANSKIRIHAIGELIPSVQILKTVDINNHPYIKLIEDLVENYEGEIYIDRDHTEQPA